LGGGCLVDVLAASGARPDVALWALCSSRQRRYASRRWMPGFRSG